jgi:UDP-glucose 4-epimerase
MNGKKKILITGGLGNLGLWLTEFFSKKRYNVYVLTKQKKHNSLKCDYHLIEADITNFENLKDKLIFDFDFCIHAASYNEYFEENYFSKSLIVNTLGTRNLLEILKNQNLFKKFIYISTFHVYGKYDGFIDENTECLPLNDYALTHYFSELYLKQFNKLYKFPFITFRLTNSYGCPKFKSTNKWYLVLNDLAKNAYFNQKITLKTNGKAKRDFIWMGDVCKIIEKSLFLKETNEIFNLSSKKTWEIIEIAEKVKKVYYKKYKKILPIYVNPHDNTKYQTLEVDNSKLLKKIPHFEFTENFENEIEKIFLLLEKNNET